MFMNHFEIQVKIVKYRKHLAYMCLSQYNDIVVLKFKKLGAKYSSTYRAWYLPYNKDNELKLKQNFKSIHFVPTDKLIQNKL